MKTIKIIIAITIIFVSISYLYQSCAGDQPAKEKDLVVLEPTPAPADTKIIPLPEPDASTSGPVLYIPDRSGFVPKINPTPEDENNG